MKYTEMFEFYNELEDECRETLDAVCKKFGLDDIVMLFDLYLTNEANRCCVVNAIEEAVSDAESKQFVLALFADCVNDDPSKMLLSYAWRRVSDGSLGENDPFVGRAVERFVNVRCLCPDLKKYMLSEWDAEEVKEFKSVLKEKLYKTRNAAVAKGLTDENRMGYAYTILERAAIDYFKKNLKHKQSEEPVPEPCPERNDTVGNMLDVVFEVLMTFKPAERSILLYLCWGKITVNDYKQKDFSKGNRENIETMKKYGLTDLKLEYVTDKSDSYYSQHKSKLKDEFCARVKKCLE